MTANDTHYTVLGVSESATPEEIKRAYRRLMSVYHPDANPGGNVDSTMATRINEANDTLSDMNKRAVYDADLRQARGRSTTAPADAPSAPEYRAPQAGGYTPAGDVFSYADLRGSGRGGRVTLTNNWNHEWSQGKQTLWFVLSLVLVAGIVIGTAITVTNLFQPSTGPATMVPRLLTVVYVGIVLSSLRWKRSHGFLTVLLILGALVWPLTLIGVHVAPWMESAAGVLTLAAVTMVGVCTPLARLAVPMFIGYWGIRPIRTRVMNRS